MTGPFISNEAKGGAYDAVIIGAGPAGLAALSALKEPFSLDHLTDPQRNTLLSKGSDHGSPKLKVAVVDPSGDWMTTWNQNFARLAISFLRSPAIAHPDAFDEAGLLAFAVARGREDELFDSGCSRAIRQGLWETDSGLWNLPSSKLFQDYCRHLASNLPHDFVAEKVIKIENADRYKVFLQNGIAIDTQAIVLAVGPAGRHVIPQSLIHVPKTRCMHWTQLHPSRPNHGIPSEWKKILVVGGGLTAVQTAQLALKQNPGCEVILCSRHPLAEKHLDIGFDWVDRRRASKCQSDFYHQSLEERWAMLLQARGGGSVPPVYIQQVRALEQQGRLQHLVGTPNFIYSDELVLQGYMIPQVDAENCVCCRRNAPLVVSIGSKIHRLDGILIACGIEADCTRHPVFQSLISMSEKDRNHPKTFKGMPVVNEDLEWLPEVFVVGSMAGLNLGPDAGNLMGMRRGATIVSNALDCRSWIRSTGNIFANRYSIFEGDDESSSSSSWDNDDDGLQEGLKTEEENYHAACEFETAINASVPQE